MPSTTHRQSNLRTRECTLSDGRTLAYTIAGTQGGRPVIAHHGTPGSRLFAAVCSSAAAAEDARLIVPDRPGYGKSSPPPEGWSWEEWRRELCDLLDAEGIERAPLVGFSGGGPFALAAATGDRVMRVGVVSTVVPPASNVLARLAAVPAALRVLFRVAVPLARVRGSEALLRQLTNQPVSGDLERAVEDDFFEAFRQGSKAAVRETRLFADNSFDAPPTDLPVRAWHGTEDDNAPYAPVQSFFRETDATLVTTENDHLGTLLDCQREVFDWVTSSPP